jgi:hypothetical protein
LCRLHAHRCGERYQLMPVFVNDGVVHNAIMCLGS